jgi:hypothetical protein
MRASRWLSPAESSHAASTVGSRWRFYRSPLDNSTTVEVSQATSEEPLGFAVAADRALEAFNTRSRNSQRRSTSLCPSPTSEPATLHVASRPPCIPACGGRISPGSAVRRPVTIAA